MDILTIILLANQSIYMYGPFSLGQAAFTDPLNLGPLFVYFSCGSETQSGQLLKKLTRNIFFWPIKLDLAHSSGLFLLPKPT